MSRITERAMLVALNISQWSARKLDKKASQDVARLHGSDVDMGRYTKTLVERDALSAIIEIARVARDHHNFNTLPWSDNGARMLTGANYFDYTTEQRRYRARFDAAVKTFTGDYQNRVQEARERLKGLFSFDDYPLASEIAGKFKMECVFSPMPTGDDFRVTLGEEEEARIRAEIETRVATAEQQAMRDLWERVHSAVSRMSRNLNSYGIDPATGRIVHPFRDSMVENLRALVEVLPKLNVSGDPHLDDMRQRLVQALCPHDAQELRDDAGLRRSVASEADAILDAMADYVGDDVSGGADA